MTKGKVSVLAKSTEELLGSTYSETQASLHVCEIVGGIGSKGCHAVGQHRPVAVRHIAEAVHLDGWILLCALIRLIVNSLSRMRHATTAIPSHLMQIAETCFRPLLPL